MRFVMYDHVVEEDKWMNDEWLSQAMVDLERWEG